MSWTMPAMLWPIVAKPLDLDQMRASLAHLVLERADDGGAVLARERHPDLARQALEHAQLLGGQIETRVVPRQREEQATRAGLAGADGEHEPRRGRVTQPGRRIRERDARASRWAVRARGGGSSSSVRWSVVPRARFRRAGRCPSPRPRRG